VSRTVHALVSRAGRYVGAAAPFEVPTSWWPDVEPVVAHLDAVLGGPTAVLRLLHVADPDRGRGGKVTYHVEALEPPADGVLDPTPMADWAAVIAPQPRRADWAEPGGPWALIEWAVGALGGPLTGRPTQVKSWNLSCVYRLPTDGGPVWAKATGAFMVGDARAIDIVAQHDRLLVPAVLAADGQRSLLRDAPGVDCFETDPATIRAVVGRWVAVQAAAADDPALDGLPSRRPAELTPWLAEVVERRRPGDPAAQRLVDALPGQVDALDAAGLPTTLVHGDFHPGNWRSDDADGPDGPDDAAQMILDWGDCYVGHPAADIQRLAEWLPPTQREIAVRAWADAWQAHRPGCDPRRALAPMRVLGQVTSAIVYQRFLDNIEPDERIYHEDDPLTEIRDAITALDLLG
jgi:hypothetical protein